MRRFGGLSGQARPAQRASIAGALTAGVLALAIYLGSDRLRTFDAALIGYATATVVLTFGQMEDLLGAPLPAPARQDPGWWNSDDDRNFGHSNSWRLAKRTAVANLVSQTVTFERY